VWCSRFRKTNERHRSLLVGRPCSVRWRCQNQGQAPKPGHQIHEGVLVILVGTATIEIARDGAAKAGFAGLLPTNGTGTRRGARSRLRCLPKPRTVRRLQIAAGGERLARYTGNRLPILGKPGGLPDRVVRRLRPMPGRWHFRGADSLGDKRAGGLGLLGNRPPPLAAVLEPSSERVTHSGQISRSR
jgi:hypothetical protein